LFLYEAGLIDLDGWLKRFGAYVKKHLWNPGRLTTSLADSGFDTWLDGYARAGGGLPAVPHRVGNFYVEGAMLAFLCDVALNQANGTWLVDAMREMWMDAQAAPRAGRPKGLTEEAYWNKLASCSSNAGNSGNSGNGSKEKLAELRANFCDGTPRDSWPSLVEAFAHQGITATLARNPNALHAAGALTRSRGDQPAEVVSVWPESPAWDAGLVPGARIHSVELSLGMDLVQVQFSHAGRSFDKALEAPKSIKELKSLKSSEELSGFSAGYFPQIELGKS
jgi:predicted metalloprotease with PDZ domain